MKNQLKKQDLIKLPEILIINIESNIYKDIPINLKDEIIEIKVICQVNYMNYLQLI